MRFANPMKKTKTIASIRGHVIDFPGKGSVAPTDERIVAGHMTLSADGLVFVNVPGIVTPEAIEAGLIPESELDEPLETVKNAAPVDPMAREDSVMKVFERLVNAGQREDFAGNGGPRLDAVVRELGWSIDGKEMKALWTKYQGTPKE